MNRKIGIGGSECAAVLGLSRWKSPYQVFIDKVSDEETSIDNDAMKWGRALEPLIVKEYQERTGNKVDLLVDEKGEQRLLKSIKHPHLMAHIDGLVRDKNLVLEAKSTRFFNDNWGDDGSDKIPIEYLIQCAHYCLVIGEAFDIEGADIAALGSTSDFRIYHYKRNEKLEKKIIEKTEIFWNEHVLKGLPPEPSVSDDLSKVYSNYVDGIVIAPDDVTEAHRALIEVKGKLKELEEKEEAYKKTLQLYMKEKTTLIDRGGVVLATWSGSKTTRLNQKRLKESGLDISEFYEDTTTRRFLVK